MRRGCGALLRMAIGTIAIACLGTSTAQAREEHRERWSVKGWEGEAFFSDGKFVACGARYFVSERFMLGLSHVMERNSHEVQVGDQDADFTWLAPGRNSGKVTLLIDNAHLRRQYPVVIAHAHIFSFLVQFDIPLYLGRGGPISVFLPDGRLYSGEFAVAPEAITNYQKCVAVHGLVTSP